MNARLPIDPAASADAQPGPPAVKWREEHILWLHRWTPTLLSFRTSRAEAFHFVPGHYARLGFPDASGGAVWRPFSMVSGCDDDYLEFFAVLVPGGEFSIRLTNVALGDKILVEKPSYGFLTLDQLAAGEDLWLLASGTGLGPFIAILRDALPWRAFDRLILVHSVRRAEELAYRREIEAIGDAARLAKLRADLCYLPVVTRETESAFLHDRIPQLLVDGRLERAAGMPLESGHSRVMACGNPELTRDIRSLLAVRGFSTSRRGVPGQMAFEKYW